LKCGVVCGGANNQLLEDKHGAELSQRDILYAPDYIANAGGVTNIACEIDAEYSAERAEQRTARIFQTMERVIAISKDEGIPTSQAADRLAQERIAAARRVKQLYLE
jgi:leucine dehydrogenase